MDENMEEFQDFIKKWALKKMERLAKKLKYYAGIYFGEPITIVYLKKDQARIVRHDAGEKKCD